MLNKGNIFSLRICRYIICKMFASWQYWFKGKVESSSWICKLSCFFLLLFFLIKKTCYDAPDTAVFIRIHISCYSTLNRHYIFYYICLCLMFIRSIILIMFYFLKLHFILIDCLVFNRMYNVRVFIRKIYNMKCIETTCPTCHDNLPRVGVSRHIIILNIKMKIAQSTKGNWIWCLCQ